MLPEELERQEIDRDDQENGRRQAEQQRSELPGGWIGTPEELVDHRDSQGVQGVVDARNQPAAKVVGLDPLGSVDITQAIGETGLGVPDHPSEQNRGAGHKEADTECVLRSVHAGASLLIFAEPARPAAGQVPALRPCSTARSGGDLSVFGDRFR